MEILFKCVREKSSIIINTVVRRSGYKILVPLNHVNLKFRLIKAFPVKVELQNVIGYVYRHGMSAGGAARFFRFTFNMMRKSPHDKQVGQVEHSIPAKPIPTTIENRRGRNTED